jgi:hypothetical protein
MARLDPLITSIGPVSTIPGGRCLHSLIAIHRTDIRSNLKRDVHALTTLVAFDCPNFPYMTERLTTLLESLKAVPEGRLTYPEIRRHLLRVPFAHLCFFYNPPEPVDVALGDIGYFFGNSFIKLENIEDDLTFKTVLNGRTEYVHASPADLRSDKMEDGSIKYVKPLVPPLIERVSKQVLRRTGTPSITLFTSASYAREMPDISTISSRCGHTLSVGLQ